jgi:hypothetical protein
MSPNAGGGGGCGVSADEYSCAHGAQISFGDLTPYLTLAWVPKQSGFGIPWLSLMHLIAQLRSI